MAMRKAKVVMAGLVAAVATAQVALAQAPVRRPGREGVRFWDRPEVRDELALSDEQSESLRTHHYESAKSAATVRSRLEVAELELDELMEAAELDEKAVVAKAKEIGEIRAQLFQQRVAYRLALKRILTPEQERKLKGLALRAQRNRAQRVRPEAPRPQARPQRWPEREPLGSEPL